MPETLGVSKKTIMRYIKDISNVKYVWKGENGHWEIVWCIYLGIYYIWCFIYKVSVEAQ